MMDEITKAINGLRADLTRLSVKYDRPHLTQVLIHHQRRSDGACICGWGVGHTAIGHSHAAHVLDVYEQERRYAGG